ncbi:MAG TPA: class I SAM-dependent methyltransferase [Ilumatobacteraceae bacterium]|nr:class I SAM-dependent methyltransferase [Ilumatobacteraceae bacterium]HRB02612.1 class I SAM-dependent methyltransferase [Ilumatobacteraceae bacterium]
MTDQIDSDALKMFSYQVFTKLEGAVTAGMIHLGDQLGLYTTMKQAGQPLTTAELADRAGLAERWVREWAHNQAAARLIVADSEGCFSLTPEAAVVFATPDHPAYGMGMFHRLPQTMHALEDVRESFRTGVGHDYDSHGPQGAVGIERSFEPWSNANLLPTVLPSVDGLVERLQAGACVVDIGCGAGSAVLLMAKEFPKSTFHGYDISQYALARAAQKLEDSGLHNASFDDPRQSPMPADNSVNFITTFDCIHDMTQPTEMMRRIRHAIKPDGVWLLVDIKALDTFEENARKNPMASLMYGISVLSCMSSALSEADGEGLGTLGLSENKARAMAQAAGFTRFRKLDVDHSVNAFYEVRP